jgi:hypothetical protein
MKKRKNYLSKSKLVPKVRKNKKGRKHYLSKTELVSKVRKYEKEEELFEQE